MLLVSDAPLAALLVLRFGALLGYALGHVGEALALFGRGVVPQALRLLAQLLGVLQILLTLPLALTLGGTHLLKLLTELVERWVWPRRSRRRLTLLLLAVGLRLLLALATRLRLTGLRLTRLRLGLLLLTLATWLRRRDLRLTRPWFSLRLLPVALGLARLLRLTFTTRRRLALLLPITLGLTALRLALLRLSLSARLRLARRWLALRRLACRWLTGPLIRWLWLLKRTPTLAQRAAQVVSLAVRVRSRAWRLLWRTVRPALWRAVGLAAHR